MRLYNVKTGIAILIFIAFIIGYVKYIEKKGIFYPIKEIEYTPLQAGFQYEDIYFTAADGVRLNGWFIPYENSRGTLLFAHGNAGNISHRLEKITFLRRSRLDIFIIDYRGYGRSAGTPSEKGLYLDVRGGYDYLVKQRGISPDKIILYGESIGAAVVIHLAARQKVGALIAESAFSCGRDMAKTIYPFLPAWFFSDSFDCLSRIREVSAPKLFIHSKNDEIVPYRLARKLYEAAAEPKQFAELTGGHNTAYRDAEEKYTSSVVSFVDGLFG